MRNHQKEEHSPCDNVYWQVNNCGIFFILEHDGENDIGEDEFGLANDFCVDDPLILTREELKVLGQKLIDIADGKS